MKIKFKLPAIAIDDDGNEQAIDLNVEIPSAQTEKIVDHQVDGKISILTGRQHDRIMHISFSFQEEHPFTASRRAVDFTQTDKVEF